MSHRVVGLGASGTVLHAVFVVHVLFGSPGEARAERPPERFESVCYCIGSDLSLKPLLEELPALQLKLYSVNFTKTKQYSISRRRLGLRQVTLKVIKRSKPNKG